MLTSPDNVIAFQQDIKLISQDHFSLRTTGSGIRIVTHCMADCKAILSYLPEHNLHHLTFYPQSDKPIKAAVRHLPIYTYSQDFTLAHQQLGYDAVSIKKMTKRPSPDDSITTVSCPCP
jgi:hypothetical protein